MAESGSAKSLSDGLAEFYSAQTEGNTSVEGNRPWSKKLKSRALAVNPSQIGEASEDARKKGVPTHFTDDGQPVFEDRTHRRKYMQAYGYFDQDGGYGDAAPRQQESHTDQTRALANARRYQQYAREQREGKR